MKKSLILVGLILLVGTVVAQPQPPHRVYGTVSDDSGDVDSLSVNFLYSGSSVASTQTNSSGEYLLDIEYNTTYENQDLELKVEDIKTGKTINYTSGEVEKLDYSGSGITQENFTVDGNIELNGSDADNADVSFYNDGNEIKSGQTNGTGYYELEINFSSDYNNEEIELYVDGDSTGKTTTFESGGSATVDYLEDSSTDSSDNTDDTDDSSSSGTSSDDSDDSTDDSDNSDSDSDSSDDGDDNSDSSDDSDSSDSSSSESKSYKVTSLDMSPKNPSPGEEVTVSVDVENDGSEKQSFEVELSAGDELLSQETDQLSPGETTTLEFKKTFDRSERYDLKAGELETTLTVGDKESGGLPIFGILGILGLLLVLGVVGFVYISGGNEGEEGEKQGAFDSFKKSKKEEGDSFDWKFADEE